MPENITNLKIPGTYFEIYDQSGIRPIQTARASTPTYLAAFASDKGPEDLQLCDSSNFFSLYGNNIDFNKYGQPLLQAASIVNNGGTILAKRIVSNAATYANLAVVAKVAITDDADRIVTNSNGANLYYVPKYSNTSEDGTIILDSDYKFFVIEEGSDIPYYSNKIDKDNKESLNSDYAVTDEFDYCYKIKIKPTEKDDKGAITLNASYIYFKNLDSVHAYIEQCGTKKDSDSTEVKYITYYDNNDAEYELTKDMVNENSIFFNRIQNKLVTINGKKATIKYELKTLKNVKDLNTLYSKVNDLYNGTIKDTSNITTNDYATYPNETDEELGLASSNGDNALTDIKEEEDTTNIDNTSLSTTSSEYVFPLFVISDNGRCNSTKRIRIVRDYGSSKFASNWFRYNLNVIENNRVIETFTFSIDPNKIDNGISRSISSVTKNSNQIIVKSFDESTSDFISVIADVAGISEDTLVANYDIIGATTKKSEICDFMEIAEKSFNLEYTYGNLLQSGDDGTFGRTKKSVVGNPNYEARLLDFFSGKDTKDIYDLDKYKIDVCVDAAYPLNVKAKIAELADFRGDFMYFRDMGTKNNTTIDEIVNKYSDTRYIRSRNITTFCQYYDIINPYDRKQITVSICYTLAGLLVAHFKNNRNKPFAGQSNGVVISNIVENTINIVPKVIPGSNQKELLDDARLNYASYYDDILTVESLYTSQENYTQLSFSNNVIAVQEVIKAIRTKCPKIRYTFIDGEDLSTYKSAVQEVLKKYERNFASLNFQYMQDSTMAENKIFYAMLEVRFRTFVQSEYFEIYALS